MIYNHIIIYSTMILPHPRHIQFPEIGIGPEISVKTLIVRECVKWHCQHPVGIYMTNQLVETFVVEIHNVRAFKITQDDL